MSKTQFSIWFQSFQQQALLCNERRLIILQGDEGWANELAQEILKDNAFQSSEKVHLSYGENTYLTPNVATKRYRDKLGSESHLVTFSISSNDDDFSVDAFAALSGTLVAGGIFFLILPSLANQKSSIQNSLFLQRLLTKIDDYPEHILIIEKGIEKDTEKNIELGLEKRALNKDFNRVDNSYLLENSDLLENCHQQTNEIESNLLFDCKTVEQVQAVQAIEKVVTGHRKRPLVLTADRGRGKSSALAIACANLIKNNVKNKANTQPLHILISAPSIQSLSVFFYQVKQSLSDAKLTTSSSTSKSKSKSKVKTKIEHAGGCIEFMPIDVLIKTQQKASLLLIDEAAAIPVYLLSQLLNNYHRMVFASTVHGYEGAGRGFTLKFQQALNVHCSQWQLLHIHQPVRWRENDPLEQFVFDTCLLNAPLADFNPDEFDTDIFTADAFKEDQLICKRITSNELIQDEQLLSQVFSILVTAHYQTSANDLKMLLDNAFVHIFSVFVQNKVVAVSLLLAEGSTVEKTVLKSDILAVKNSEKRLRNQLLPQSLFSYCGIDQAFNLSYFRVLRIAVHPQLQQQGIGSYFLEEITQYCANQGADFVGSSFGANNQLLSFWLKAEFELARIGFTQDKASGEHSALVLKPLSIQAKAIQQQLTTLFYRSFDHLLVDEYQQLNVNLVLLVLQHCPKENLSLLTEYDRENVKAFVQGERIYSVCVYSLYLWLKQQIVINKNSTDKAFLLFIERVIQKHSIKVVCEKYKLTGQKALNDYFKNHLVKYF